MFVLISARQINFIIIIIFIIISSNINCYLSKAALADDLQDFVAVRDVVVWNVDVGSLIIVVAAVVGSAHDPRPLLGIWSNKVN